MKSNIIYSEEKLDEFASFFQRTSETLAVTLKTLYILAEKDFYNVSATDVFKIAISDITEPRDVLRIASFTNFSKAKSELWDDSRGFSELKTVIFYYFAARLPYFNRLSGVAGNNQANKFFSRGEMMLLSEKQLKHLFEICEEKAGGFDASNYCLLTEEEFKSNLRYAKTSDPEPPFEARWLKKFCAGISEKFNAIENRNLFFYGAAPALFALLGAAARKIFINAAMTENFD